MDWKKDYLDSADHPHRRFLIEALANLGPNNFKSLIEIGCASGPNLVNVQHYFPNVEMGGVDVSKDALATAKKYLPKAAFDVASADDLFFPNKCADVCVTDMTLIYLDPTRIHRAISEIRRCTKRFCVFVEFHSPNPIKRLLLRLFTGYHSYDYKRLLKKHGFSEVTLRKIREDEWPGGEPQKTFGYFITAVP